jgi:DNA-directed RNA polymerase subunit RPC12/RpoP
VGARASPPACGDCGWKRILGARASPPACGDCGWKRILGARASPPACGDCGWKRILGTRASPPACGDCGWKRILGARASPPARGDCGWKRILGARASPPAYRDERTASWERGRPRPHAETAGAARVVCRDRAASPPACGDCGWKRILGARASPPAQADLISPLVGGASAVLYLLSVTQHLPQTLI